MNNYEILSTAGEGAFGVVLKCRDRRTDNLVAVKKIKKTNNDYAECKEATLLRELREENIVQLKDCFTRRSTLYLVFEFVEQNMLQIIQQSPSGLPPNLTRNYTYQLLKALFACHSRNIIHQDVKPENMLVTSDNVLKLCDFGYAVRSVNSNGTSSNLESSVYTEFIATRWYRSPEVLLGARCGKDADMWSAGCIVGEMADGRPLFPGQSELDQLFVIQTVLGPLSTRQRNMFYTSPRYTQLRLPTVAKASKGLDKRYRHKMCAKLLDCMKGLLAIDACNRLDVNQALRHKVFIPEVAMDASNANHRSNHHTPTVTSSSPALHSHRSSDDQGSPYLDSGGEGSPTQHYGSGAGKANRHSIAVHMNEVANKRAPTSNMENRKDYGSLRKPMRDPSQKVLKRTTSNKDTLFGAYRDAHQSKVTCDTQPNSSPNDNQNQQPKYSYMPLKSNSSNSSGSNKQANNQSSSFIQDAINSFWTDGPNSILAPPSNLQHLNAATPGLSQSQGQTNKQQPLNNLDIRQKADPKIDSYQFSQTGVVRPAKFSPGGGDTLPFADDLEASMLSIEAAVDTTLEKIARNNNIYNGHRFATDESFKSSRDTESQAKDSTLRASQFENPSDDIYSRSVPPAIAADDFCEDFEDEMDAEFSEEPITKEMKPVSPYHSRVDRLKVGSQFDRRPHSSGDNKPMLCDAELSDETGSSGPSVGDVANITSGASHDKTFSENERPESETKLVAPIAPLVDESFDLEYQCDQILESNITRSGTWCDEDRSREPANQPVQKNSNRLIPGAVHMETLPIPKQRDAQPTRERNRASSENRGNRVRQMVETSVDSGHSSNYVRLEANIDHPGLFAKLAGGQLPQGEKVGNESPRSKSSSKKSSQELSPLPPSKFKTPPMSPNADHTETVHDHHHHHTSSADSSKLIDDDDKYFDCPLSQVDSDTLSIRDPGMPISFSDNFDPQSHRDIGSQQALQNEETSQSLELDAISDSFDSSEALLSKGKLHSLLDKTADAPFTSVSTDKLEIVMDDSKLNSAILSADSTKFESNTECGINSCKTLKGAAPIATTHVFHCGDDSRIESSEPEFSDQCTHNSIDATTVTPAEFVPNSENLNMETEISPGDNGAALVSNTERAVTASFATELTKTIISDVRSTFHHQTPKSTTLCVNPCHKDPSSEAPPLYDSRISDLCVAAYQTSVLYTDAYSSSISSSSPISIPPHSSLLTLQPAPLSTTLSSNVEQDVLVDSKDLIKGSNVVLHHYENKSVSLSSCLEPSPISLIAPLSVPDCDSTSIDTPLFNRSNSAIDPQADTSNALHSLSMKCHDSDLSHVKTNGIDKYGESKAKTSDESKFTCTDQSSTSNDVLNGGCGNNSHKCASEVSRKVRLRKSSEVSRLRQLRQTMSRSLYNEATESHVQLDSGPSYLPLSSSTEHGHHLGGEGEQESVVPYPPLRSPILTTNYSIQAPDKENNRLATQSKRPRSAVTQATRSFRPAALPAGSGDWGNKTTSPVSTSSSNGHDRRYHPRSPPPSAPPLAKSEIFDDDTPWLASGDSYDRDITIGRRPRCSTTSSGSNHHQHQSNNSPMDIRTKRAPPNQLPSPLLRTSPSSHCDLSSGGSTGSSSAGHHFSAATTPASPTGYSPRGGAGTRDTATLERGQMSASHSPLDMIRGALIPRSNHSNNGTHHQQPGRKGRSSSTLRRSCSYESISTEHNSSTSKQPSQKKTSIGLQLLRQIGLKRIRKFGSTAATNTAGNTPTSSGTRCPNGSGGCNDNVCGSCLPTASSPSGGNGGGVNLCCPPSSACSTQFKYR